MYPRCQRTATLAIAVVCDLADASSPHARGAAAIANIFAGSDGCNLIPVEIDGGIVRLALGDENVIGRGFDTTITATAAVLNPLSAIANQGSNEQMNDLAQVTIDVSGGLTAAALDRTFTSTGGSLIALPGSGSLVFVGGGLQGLAQMRLGPR